MRHQRKFHAALSKLTLECSDGIVHGRNGAEFGSKIDLIVFHLRSVAHVSAITPVMHIIWHRWEKRKISFDWKPKGRSEPERTKSADRHRQTCATRFFRTLINNVLNIHARRLLPKMSHAVSLIRQRFVSFKRVSYTPRARWWPNFHTNACSQSIYWTRCMKFRIHFCLYDLHSSTAKILVCTRDKIPMTSLPDNRYNRCQWNRFHLK